VSFEWGRIWEIHWGFYKNQFGGVNAVRRVVLVERNQGERTRSVLLKGGRGGLILEPKKSITLSNMLRTKRDVRRIESLELGSKVTSKAWKAHFGYRGGENYRKGCDEGSMGIVGKEIQGRTSFEDFGRGISKNP